MIKSISAINFKGEQIKMVLSEPWDSGFYVKSVDGLGPPKANVSITDIAGADGGEYNSARAETRNIVLSLGFYQHDNATIEDIRLKSYKYFPIKKPLTVMVETDARTTFIDGYVESNEPEIFSETEGCQVSILCPNPFWKSDSKTVVINGLEQLFFFPFSNESVVEPKIFMGNIQNNRYRTIEYIGDTDAGMLVNIHVIEDMKATTLTIVNTTFGESMVIDTTIIKSILNYNLDEPIEDDKNLYAGDDIQISTIKGDRRITYFHNNVLYNVLNSVARGTAWLQLYNGDNIIGYNAYFIDAETEKKNYEDTKNIEVKIGYKDMYEGI